MVGGSYFKGSPVRGDGLGFNGTLREVAVFGWALNSSAQSSLDAHLVNKWSAGRPPSSPRRVAAATSANDLVRENAPQQASGLKTPSCIFLKRSLYSTTPPARRKYGQKSWPWLASWKPV
jgi:hypothetical protein